MTVSMMRLMTATFLLIATSVSASNYEDNSTNVGVYVNHISACNLNHDTGNMLCLNRMFESVIQYHDVRDTAFCPFHYCVLFGGERNKVTCTGYVYLKMSGSMDEYLNPLTPNKDNEKFTGDPKNDYVKVGTAFLNYNVLIDRFEQSVETSVDSEIQKVTCAEPYSTCLEYSDGSNPTCFGAQEVVFHTMVESALLGLVVPGSLAFLMYALSGAFYKSCLTNPCFSVITIPLLVAICCVLILFVGSDFIVKVFPFLFASIFGVILGFLCTKSMYGALDLCKRQWAGRVGDSYGAGGETETSQFVIGSDGASDDDDEDDQEVTNKVTEIELNKVDDGDEV